MPQTIHFNSFWFDFQAENLSNDITKNGSNLTFDKKADNFFLDEKKGNDHDGDDVLSARLVGQVDLSNDAKNGLPDDQHANHDHENHDHAHHEDEDSSRKFQSPLLACLPNLSFSNFRFFQITLEAIFHILQDWIS